MHGAEHRPALARPRAAREKRLATRSLLEAAGRGDCQGIRKLALEMGAEMSGHRAKDGQGNDPMQLLCASGHLTPAQVRSVKKELVEVPQLLGAAEAARAKAKKGSNPWLNSSLKPGYGGATPSTTRGLQPRISLVDSGLFAEREVGPPPELPPSRLRRTASRPETATERLMSSSMRLKDGQTRGVFASLANSVVGDRARETLCSTALYDRRLLRSDPLSTSMPCLSHALRSEQLAVSAVTRSPDLLQIDGERFKRLVPTLITVFGGKEADAAYAVSVRPELLEVQDPPRLLDTFKVLCDCVGTMEDARFMAQQTLAPASIVVTARSWCRDDFVGEYTRIQGARVEDRPVYKKPASAMAHLGKGRDMYIVYSEGHGSTDGKWLITPFFAGSSGASSRKEGRLAAPSAAHIKSESSEALACANDVTSTPDQVDDKWSFKDFSTSPPSWAPDAYVEVADSGKPRLRSLLTVPPQQLRHCFDLVKEALCFVWREGEQDGLLHESVHLLGCHLPGDAPLLGSSLRFGHLGKFKHSAGYLYLQLSAGRKLASTMTLKAWEPIVVTLMYPEEEKPEQPVEEPQEAVSKKESVAAKKEPAAAKKESAPAKKESAPAKGKADPVEEPEEEIPDHHVALGEGGFRPLRTKGLDLPQLRQDPTETRAYAKGSSIGKPVVGEVFSRTFARGDAEVPIPLGPAGLPPLVFVKLSIAATGCATGAPCESIKADDGEAAFMRTWPPKQSDKQEVNDGDATEIPLLERSGDLGYSDFNYFLTFPEDASRETKDKLMVIDSDHRFKSVIVIFHPPWLRDPVPTEAEGASTQPPMPTLPPAWIKGARWAPFESKTAVVLSKSGQQCPASFLFTKDFEPGRTNLPGAGVDSIMLVFWKRVGDPRIDADGVRTVLQHQPSLLAAGENVAHCIHKLRSGFGDAYARKTLSNRWQEWTELCQREGTGPLEAWLAQQRAESLGSHVGGAGLAKRALRCHDPEKVQSVPALAGRCEALAGVIGADHIRAAVARRPDLLVLEGDTFQRSLAALQPFLDDELARRVLRSKPGFLTEPEVLEDFLARVQKAHPKVAARRMRERTFKDVGEWSRWIDMVGEPWEVLSEWLARLSVEERVGSCQDRLRRFGGVATR